MDSNPLNHTAEFLNFFATDLYIERVDVGNVLARHFVFGVVLHAQEVEQVFLVLREAGPQDEDLGLVDGGGAAVLHVVDVEDLLADLVLEVILVRDVLRRSKRLVKISFLRFFF